MPRGESSQWALAAVELVEQGGDRAMRLGDGQRVAVILGPDREDRVEPPE